MVGGWWAAFAKWAVNHAASVRYIGAFYIALTSKMKKLMPYIMHWSP